MPMINRYSDLTQHPLSAHFSWREANISDTAKEKGLNNTIPDALLENVIDTAGQLELVRTELGSGPLRICSWYRSPAVNAAVGGAKTSYHMRGLAVDFKPTTVGLKVAFEIIARCKIQFDQLIQEHTASGANWIHIGFAEPGHAPRRDIMRASGATLGGKMVFTRVREG